MLENTEGTIKKWTIQIYWDNWVHKTQGEDKPKTHPYTHRRDNKKMANTEKLAKLGTQETRQRRKTKQNIHHYRQPNTNNVDNTRALLQTTTVYVQ